MMPAAALITFFSRRDALKYLRILSCKYRLSREVLHYGIPEAGSAPPAADNCGARPALSSALSQVLWPAPVAV